MVNAHACDQHTGGFMSGIRVAAVKAAVMVRVSTMMMVQFTVGSCFDDYSRRHAYIFANLQRLRKGRCITS